MIKIRWRTNLDGVQREKFPDYLRDRPQPGDLIRSSRTTKYDIEFEICRCVWIGESEMEVEFNIVKSRFGTIPNFYACYERMCREI